MIFAWIPIVSIFVFYRIEKFWFAVGLSLPFGIASDYLDQIYSNPDVDLISSVAIIFALLGANVFVLVYFARRWTIAWNKKFINSNDSQEP
jgi:hypothetical protein